MSRWNTKLPWIAVVIFFLGCVLWLSKDRQVTRKLFPQNSARNTSPEGLSLAYAYLKNRLAQDEAGLPVDLLSRPVRLASLERNAVLMRIGPKRHPGDSLFAGRIEMEEEASEQNEADPGMVPETEDQLLTPAELEWIQAGGRLVLGIQMEYGPLEITNKQQTTAVNKVFPLWPRVNILTPHSTRALKQDALHQGHTIFARGELPLISRQRIGAGDVIVLSTPEVFTNKRLGEAGHLALLEAVVGEGRPVYFDEHIHGLGSDAGTIELLKGWGLGPLLVLMSVAAAAAFWRKRKRIGPPEEDREQTRTEVIDFVSSLAQLYNRALPRHKALALYHADFKQAVSKRMGLYAEALEARVSDLTKGLALSHPAGNKNISRHEFMHALNTLNEAFRRLEDARRK